MFKYLTTVGGIQHAGLVTRKTRKRIEKHVEIIAVRETGLTSVSGSELYMVSIVQLGSKTGLTPVVYLSIHNICVFYNFHNDVCLIAKPTV